jgi:hypothetical protein
MVRYFDAALAISVARYRAGSSASSAALSSSAARQCSCRRTCRTSHAIFGIARR